jgi:PhnB protein
MSRVSTYLNFPGTTEEAFNFYRSVFGTEFESDFTRMSATPSKDLKEEDKNLIMHVSLPILGEHILMGTDATESLGHPIKMGNNISINLEPEKYDEAKRLFDALSDGGKIELALKKMFWGDYFASFTDKFGVSWMINCADKNDSH